jgi:hypothetical protein
MPYSAMATTTLLMPTEELAQVFQAVAVAASSEGVGTPVKVQRSRRAVSPLRCQAPSVVDVDPRQEGTATATKIRSRCA